jgi:hypothetical protein
MHSDYFKRFWTRNQGALKVFALGNVHTGEGRAAFRTTLEKAG